MNREITLDSMSAFIFYPYMGTRLYDMCKESNLIDIKNADSTLLNNSVIKNSKLSKERLNGLLRTFCLYARFPKDRWKEIEEIELQKPGSEEIFKVLSKEYEEKYF